jgi:hypothetical protein
VGLAQSKRGAAKSTQGIGIDSQCLVVVRSPTKLPKISPRSPATSYETENPLSETQTSNTFVKVSKVSKRLPRPSLGVSVSAYEMCK